MILGELAQQVSTTGVELGLQLGVVQLGGLAALQPLEGLPRRREVARLGRRVSA